jgi:hypothetical protein
LPVKVSVGALDSNSILFGLPAAMAYEAADAGDPEAATLKASKRQRMDSVLGIAVMAPKGPRR